MELLLAEIEAKITEIHRVVGPFVAFLVTPIDLTPTLAQVLSIVLKLFLNMYFSLLIKSIKQ